MDLDNLAVLNMTHKNMRYLTEKQRVVAENLANATTPDYLPKDVMKPNFQQHVEEEQRPRLSLQTTNQKHLTSKFYDKKEDSSFENVVYTPAPTSPLTIDGNGVVIEDQLNQASKASGEYNRMVTIYNKYRTMLKTANTKINI